MTKTCFKCGVEKSLEDFYSHPKMADGHLGKCKDCTKKDSAIRISLVKLNPDWLRSERARCREKQNRLRSLGLEKKYPRKPNPDKIKAGSRRKARRALLSGVILKPNACNRCGCLEELQMHHEDYNKPLAVEFLCSKCHGITHRKP